MSRYSDVRIALLVTLTVIAGCATTPSSEYEIPRRRAADRLKQMDRWMAGEFEVASLAEARAASIDQPASDLSDAESERAIIHDVTAAEMLYWSGDVERAFDVYARALRVRPGHPMARFAAARLYQLRDRVVNYRNRMADVLDEIAYDEVGALTRVDLSLAAQTVAHRHWERSESSRPFRADDIGFPSRWRVTPAVSTWPMLDIDQQFAPETEPTLAESYVSPGYAEQDPKNREPVRPYNSDGLNLSPNFASDGIYYLETFVTVAPLEDSAEGQGSHLEERSFWVYGSLSGGATVWIDGKRVLNRRMDTYGTSKRLRRVSLEPGTHRVLVKLGYEQDYRDWFDLAFLGDRATPMSGSGLTFSRTPTGETSEESLTSGANVELLSDQYRPSVLERLRVPAEAITDKTAPVALYWTAVAGTLAHEPNVFEPAWRELMRRFPDFAAGHALKAQQLRTLWELPYDMRRARARSRVKQAHEANPENVYYLTKLVEILRSQGASDDRLRRHLRLARQAAFTGDGAAIRKGSSGQPETLLIPEERRGRLKTIEPLTAWASWLSDKGWQSEAEDAWRAVLQLEPASCRAARQLQSHWYERGYFPGLEAITDEHAACPSLKWQWSFHQPQQEVSAYRLAYRKRQANRYPLDAGSQISLATAYRARGESDKAKQVIDRALSRMPRNGQLWMHVAESRFADADEIEAGRRAASAALLDGLGKAGSTSGLLMNLGWLADQTPLTSYLRDGRKLVREHLRNEQEMRGPGGQDSAYFVLDFALRKYLPDGGSLTLTHTITRVMTKGAIDRFGEQPIPSNQYLLRARTINPDGTVDIPERTAGKSTLSMPGLDEGDFVELAWVQYNGPSYLSHTHYQGMRFFFRMPDISSVHSEYVVMGPDDMKFIRRNGPPSAEGVSSDDRDTSLFPAGYGWDSGVRFLKKGSSRPRSEPYSVDGEEFLPWVQMYREGVKMSPFEIRRRQIQDQLQRVLKISDPLREEIAQWRAGTEPGSMAEVRQLFYAVTEHVTQGNYLDFQRDASHVAVTGEGSRLVLLKAAYDVRNIESDIYMVKSKYEAPTVLPMGESKRYGRAVLRVETPSGVVWLAPKMREAMFGAIPVGSIGQPAYCVTCASGSQIRTSLPPDGHEGYRPNTRRIEIRGELDRQGTLTGTAELTFHGIRAANVRRTLRQRTDTAKRRAFFDSVMSNVVPGASLKTFNITDEQSEDEPLVLTIEFERTGFARGSETASGAMRIQTAVFGTPLASRYGSLSARQRPLLIPRQRNDRQTLIIDLPEGMTATIESKRGEWSYDSSFGEFERQIAAKDGELHLTNRLQMPIQRVGTEQYRSFQKWATKVERSARMLVSVSPDGS
jgi:tetratricopeptide (TPR) repeat protein